MVGGEPPEFPIDARLMGGAWQKKNQLVDITYRHNQSESNYF